MPGVADLLRAAELQEEFSGPVGYSEKWAWIALLLVLAVAVYFHLSWLLTRPRRREAVRVEAGPDVRSEHLARIDRVEAGVHAGALTARDGHQQLSEVVRSFAATVTTLPARTMALADFRAHAPQTLVDAIELMYPPEFAPDDDGVAHERFGDAVHRARELVATWN